MTRPSTRQRAGEVQVDAEEEQRFEEHLLLCATCRERADHASEIAAAVAALRVRPGSSPPN